MILIYTKVLERFQNLAFIIVCLDYIQVISKGDWIEHMDKLEKTLQTLAEAGQKLNSAYCSFGREKTNYLGYLVSKDDVK